MATNVVTFALRMQQALPRVARRSYPADMGCQFIRGAVVRGRQPTFCDEPRAEPRCPYCILHARVCFDFPGEQGPAASDAAGASGASA